MFERFTERARQVVVLAQDEARALGHQHIGSEHLLLGLIRENEGIAARVLASLGVGLDEARADVVRIVGRGEGTPTGQIPFTPRGKRALELSLRESQELSHNYIGTEHLLLGLARLDDGVANEILTARGITAERIRAEVLSALGGAAGTAGAAAPRAAIATERHRVAPRPSRFAAPTVFALGWLLGAVTLGVGILIGWAIWG